MSGFFFIANLSHLRRCVHDLSRGKHLRMQIGRRFFYYKNKTSDAFATNKIPVFHSSANVVIYAN